MLPSSSSQNVLVVGATGRFGGYILRSLLQSSFDIHVLTREKSTEAQHSKVSNQSQSQPRLASIPSKVPVHRTDYSLPSLISILKSNSIDTVVCALSAMPESIALQHKLIDACLEAGVGLFIPSEFGMDTYLPQTRKMVLGLFDMKYEILQRLEILASEGRLNWSAIICGASLDMCIHDGELDVDLYSRVVTIWDDGDTTAYGSTMPFVGDGVRALLENSGREGMLNRVHYIAEASFTQNELFEFVKTKKPGSWQTKKTTVDEGQVRGKDAFGKGDVLSAIQPLLFSAVWSGDLDFEGNGRKLSNWDLGLGGPELERAWKGVEAWERG